MVVYYTTRLNLPLSLGERKDLDVKIEGDIIRLFFQRTSLGTIFVILWAL